MFSTDLSHATALVCGATQGIGLATAQMMARMGARVILVARHQSRLDEALATLAGGQKHLALALDLHDTARIAPALHTLFEREQISAVHILVNNTGGPPPGLAIDASPDEYLKAFTGHLLAGQVLAQTVVPGMKKAGYGRIINVISTSVKAPIPGLGVSNTIRGAVANWSKTLARELAPHGITVNNVLPGLTTTPRLDALMRKRAEEAGQDEQAYRHEAAEKIPVGRFAAPEEIAAGITFLASAAAAYITGINLPIDGGNTPSL